MGRISTYKEREYSNGKNKTNKRRTKDEQKTNKRRTKDEEKTNNERTNDEEKATLKQRKVKAKRELKKRILVDFNFGKVQGENPQTNSGRL